MPVAPQTTTSPWSPGRPPSVKDVEQAINGDFDPLGVITSTGTAVDNGTTASPFCNLPPSGSAWVPGQSLAGTLAGRVLVLQAIAAGFVLTSRLPINFTNGALPTIVTADATLPAGTFSGGYTTFPGFNMSAGQIAVVTMSSLKGWLQWISSSGTASLKVWEQA